MIKIRGMSLSTFCRASLVGLQRSVKPRYVFLCIADHFEPDWRGAPPGKQSERVRRWVEGYPRLFSHIRDSRDRAPQHTFFYPMEVYDPRHVENLCRLVQEGYGDIEIHLHHENDCSEALTERMLQFGKILHGQHGLLSKDSSGQVRYGFIHGNWALDNSHPEGKHCGVNDELTVLIRTGCYADFTMPAAPHPAQTSTINQLYYAVDDPKRPKSHDRGIRAAIGQSRLPDSLLMVQGPLLLSIQRTQRAVSFPSVRLENGNLSSSQPPAAHRIRQWIRAGVSVAGRPDWVFIKLHTHGAQEANMEMLLGTPMQKMHATIHETSIACDFQYFYVTAREMAQLIHQVEDGRASPDFSRLAW